MGEASNYKESYRSPDSDTGRQSEWLARIAAGDDLAFAALYHAWRDKLYSFALRLSDSEILAEEVVQDSFLKIWERRETLKEVSNFSAYLFRTARNHLINALKRRKMEHTILTRIDTGALTQARPTDPSQALDSKQFNERLRGAIDALPEQQRKVYSLSREQGWRQDEIARYLDISVSTVKTHMTHALRTLREEFRDKCPPGTLPLILALTSLLTQ